MRVEGHSEPAFANSVYVQLEAFSSLFLSIYYAHTHTHIWLFPADRYVPVTAVVGMRGAQIHL